MKHFIQLQTIVPDNIQDITLQNHGVDGLSILAIAAAISVFGFMGYSIYNGIFPKKDPVLDSLALLRTHLKNEKEIHDYMKRLEKLREDLPNSTQENGFSETCSGISNANVREDIVSVSENSNSFLDHVVSSENQFFLGNPQDPDSLFENAQDLLEAKKTIFYEEIGKVSSLNSEWCLNLEQLVQDMDDISGPVEEELVDSVETITSLLENPSGWGYGFDLNAVKEQAFSVVDLCCQNPEFLWFGEALINIITR